LKARYFITIFAVFCITVIHGDAYKTYIMMSIKVVVDQCVVVSLHVYSVRSHCCIMYTLYNYIYMDILYYIVGRERLVGMEVIII